MTFTNLYNFDTILSKYSLYVKHVLYNEFLNDQEKDACVDIFMRFQRVVLAINKLKHMYRRKKCTVYDVSTDLNLTPLCDYDECNVIELMENNTLYRFALIDLLRIFNTSLRMNEYLTCKPIHPRNPYTNLKFSIPNIYNIYYALLFNTRYVMKSHIHSYIEQCINLRTFYENNVFLLKSSSVVDFINNQSDNTLFRYVCEMFDDYSTFTIIRINREIQNKSKIIKKVEKLLYYYLLIQQFAYDDEIHIKYEAILIRLIKKFTALNPQFGRRVLRVVRHNRTDMAVDETNNNGVEDDYEEGSGAGDNTTTVDENIHNTIFPRELIQRYNIETSNNILRINTSGLNSVSHIEDNTNIFYGLLANNPFSPSSQEISTSEQIMSVTNDIDDVIRSLPTPENIPTIEEWAENVLINSGEGSILDEESESEIDIRNRVIEELEEDERYEEFVLSMYDEECSLDTDEDLDVVD